MGLWLPAVGVVGGRPGGCRPLLRKREPLPISRSVCCCHRALTHTSKNVVGRAKRRTSAENLSNRNRLRGRFASGRIFMHVGGL
ncbi:hypothetical protein BS50DRAFT_104232 [Corynespora cassiicola Philippines]|uniref:Uncharacterized protein n=1 Tax=Corynespora cassiicola Philippines TaxID=1448308 RepID=A0A2T2NDG6_CORCC|nr:hypothetical protein BS50DRAFT_104232 [Corynespora cassiicola Philippines]